jgi:hypothetical protein
MSLISLDSGADGQMIDGADSLSKTPRVMNNNFAQTFLPVRSPPCC